MNRPTRHPAARAFTLIECVCAITVIAVTSAVVLPIISGATSAYANAARARDVTDDAAYAMDRCLNLLRDAPIDASTGAVKITSASSSSVLFSDQRGISMTAGVISLRNESGVSGTLLTGVTSFSIGYYDQTGAVSTLATPGTTWMFTVQITASGFDLRGNAFVRARSLGS